MGVTALTMVQQQEFDKEASRTDLVVNAVSIQAPKSPSAYTVKIHNDIIEWKYFRRNLPFMKGIHQSPTRSFNVFFHLRLNKRSSK